MKHMFAEYENIIPTQDTYGYITNAVRKQWGLEKTHANDASVIVICDSNGFIDMKIGNIILMDLRILEKYLLGIVIVDLLKPRINEV